MEINGLQLNITEDGEGIYINNFIVDDKRNASDYFKGFQYWKELLTANGNFDFKSRHEFISEIRNKN